MVAPRTCLSVLASSIAILGGLGGVACSDAQPEGPPRGRTTQAILAGKDDAAHTSTGMLLRSSADFSTIDYACTAVVVSDRLVATAAHCVVAIAKGQGTPCNPAEPDRARSVYAADRFLLYTDAVVMDEQSFVGKKALSIKSVHFPEEAKTMLCGHDVALLELAEPVGPDVAPVEVRTGRTLVVGDAITAVGYGADGKIDQGGRRRSRSGLAVTTVGALDVDGKPKSTASEWLVDTGPCEGDSGGPAFDADGALVGIMSRGSPRECTSMVYSRIDAEGGQGVWLRETANAIASASGTSPPAWAQLPDEGAADAGASEPASSTSGCHVVAPSEAGGVARLRLSLVMLAPLAGLVARRRRRRV